MTVWWMNRKVDLPWQSTNKRSLETVMFRNIAGLFEMAVCCAKPPYAARKWPYDGYLVRWINRTTVQRVNRMVDLPWQSTDKRNLETVMFRNVTGLFEMVVCCAKPPYAFPY
ncbi:hypothetical protein [Methylobacter sp. BBA5.1]|uniref:hypothetical protein n=1 Tax=Methylobacter sp. BBA5.1 TaxID=1495064 RepID=UPI00056156B3|nr:hypothetical protein [Methylobacter sp. BBA5.1]